MYFTIYCANIYISIETIITNSSRWYRSKKSYTKLDAIIPFEIEVISKYVILAKVSCWWDIPNCCSISGINVIPDKFKDGCINGTIKNINKPINKCIISLVL